MNIHELFLEALRASLLNEHVQWNTDISLESWQDLFALASEHQVLPMIYEAVYSCPSAVNADPRMMAAYKRQTIQMVMMQTVKTNEFLGMYQYLREHGIKPLVVKGIICRSLYPNPDYRMSGDEDMLIEESIFPQVHQAMMDYGMSLSDPSMDIEKEYEVPYGKKGSPLYIELHKHLFPPTSEAYGNLNKYFENVHTTGIEEVFDGVSIYTMNHTDHLFYLICHSFKHFLHSGFGLRQVCDIILYANAYGSNIDWMRILNNCREINADKFAAALFKIGKNYLVFDEEKACYPEEWKSIAVDETMMLEDLLNSGVYGASTMSRKHSSTMTLEAVAAEKEGKKTSHGVLKSLFPSAKDLENRYSYLKKYPVLLPVAWTSRIITYSKETAKGSKDNNAAEAMKIGAERIELMKEYGILKKY